MNIQSPKHESLATQPASTMINDELTNSACRQVTSPLSLQTPIKPTIEADPSSNHGSHFEAPGAPAGSPERTGAAPVVGEGLRDGVGTANGKHQGAQRISMAKF